MEIEDEFNTLFFKHILLCSNVIQAESNGSSKVLGKNTGNTWKKVKGNDSMFF